MKKLLILLILVPSFANAQVITVSPGSSIQKAVDKSSPGDVVALSPGTYSGDVKVNKDGISITGPKDAIVKGKARVFDVTGKGVTLNGFTVNGGEKLIYATGADNLNVSNMSLKNAGGECLRLKDSNNSEVSGNDIGPCGKSKNKKNGEGVYIGTAPEQGGGSSNNNIVRGNNINTNMSEGVDIKEGSTGNIVEGNSIKGSKDSDSGGVSIRGNSNTVRNNQISNNSGAGVRLGGDTLDQGINNNVYSNTISDNKKGGIKMQANPQANVSGNTMRNNIGGDFVGTYSK